VVRVGEGPDFCWRGRGEGLVSARQRGPDLLELLAGERALAAA
jgi:hypothetical protein